MKIAFAVFDSKAAAFGMPMFLANEGLALRSFSDACADEKSFLFKHPSDYTLMKIGTYEENSGELTAVIPPVHIASAAAVVEMLRPTLPIPAPVAVPEVA